MARSFDGSTQALAVPSADLMPFDMASDGFSFAVRLRATGALKNGAVFSLVKSSLQENFAYLLTRTDGALNLTLRDNTSTTTGGPVTPAGTVALNTWYVVSGYVSATKQTLFVNGANKVTTTLSFTPWVAFGEFAVGRMLPYSTQYFQGDLAELAIWKNVELTDAEHATLGTTANPWTVRPESITDYFPMYGTGGAASTETSLVNRRYLTPVGNPPQSTHPTLDALPEPVFSAPVSLFTGNLRLAYDGASRLHAFGTNSDDSASGQVQHRYSDDQGANWSVAANLGPGAEFIPLYGSAAAAGARAYCVARTGTDLKVYRSADSGLTWLSTTLAGGGVFTSNADDRVHISATGTDVHVFAGKAGATASADKQVYYWRSTDGGAAFATCVSLDSDATLWPSPGGVSADGGNVHIIYAKAYGSGTLPHRAAHLRSTDRGANWSTVANISGGSTQPQIRPRAYVRGSRVYGGWEAPTDHNSGAAYPNATRSNIAIVRSTDDGANFGAPASVTNLPDEYVNHPEFVLGPGPMVHVLYRISTTQLATPPASDPLGYRKSDDYGVTWGRHQIAVALPTSETHPYQLAASATYVHAATSSGLYTRREFTPVAEAALSRRRRRLTPFFP